jgi:two-component system, NarL family, sensor histidine kinase YdfH
MYGWNAAGGSPKRLPGGFERPSEPTHEDHTRRLLPRHRPCVDPGIILSDSVRSDNAKAHPGEYNPAMKKIRALCERALSLWKAESEWPFMLFLTAILGFIYVWTVAVSGRLRIPGVLVLFTVLFILHLALHWFNIWWLKRGWNNWIYLVIQTALVFTMVSFAGVLGALFGLYMGVLGEAVGMMAASWRKKAAAVAGILAVSAVNYLTFMPGSEFIWWIIAIVPMTFFVIIYVVLYSRQAEARVKAQRLLGELEAANKRLTESAGQIEDLTLANERQRMARELHDTLAQGLAGLILQLEAADAHLGGGRPERAQVIVRRAMARARGTLAESRRAIDGLRREIPDDFGAAVRAEVGHFTTAAGIPCQLTLECEEPLPDSVKELALQSTSECLTNVARHAQAGRASVLLRREKDVLKIEVGDDGIGFDAGAADRAGHYGLIGLRERARQIGGSLEIQSGAGKGTTVNMLIPIPLPSLPH